MKRRGREWIPITVLICAAAGAGVMERPTPSDEMAAAAGAFLASLTPELRALASRPFDDVAREDWHYIPREHAGVEFASLDSAQKISARALMRSTLSSRGMNKVEEIMLLDDLLRGIEKSSGPRRDPLAYAITVFGTPGRGAWGWKLEGHHVSLNFTGAGERLAVTPSFLGANPAEVREGDRAGVRVLAAEEDIGRELLESLSPEQKREAILDGQPPSDIIASPGRSLDTIDSRGLAVSSMSEAQRGIVVRLLREFADNLRHDVSEEQWARIEGAGLEKIRFAWIGGESRGQGHYYRLSGPTFVVELDNTQNNANHVHTAWRDRERDFGHDLLKEHVEQDHRAK